MPQRNDRQAKADLRAVLAQRAGQRLLARLLAGTGVLASSYVPGDALATARNEGARGFGLHLLAHIKATAPEHYATILTFEEGAHESDHGDSDEY